MGYTLLGQSGDVGNYSDGYVAGNNGLLWPEARVGFDGYQIYHDIFIDVKWPSFEGEPTKKAQELGYDAGFYMFDQN
ncbi:hypothetical protein GA0116948_104189 [Chitinophaga costaii]|uniref:Uncharacterized protein n=1 Tax=Chitinophaga costaii TaxID=1335309 RepID=A0A1C4CLM0_9BACT|nr:hypothetical protein [Chitinophaga costaii]PUZ27038.1 hypothetical protein DCM91_07345 [Chitinophaga costaii]SCC19981.1 hypothetical protein GA0116948_104189 [Chitinophaga costaii]